MRPPETKTPLKKKKLVRDRMASRPPVCVLNRPPVMTRLSLQVELWSEFMMLDEGPTFFLVS